MGEIIVVSPLDSVNSTVIVEEAHNSPLRVDHLSFLGIGQLDIRARLKHVSCLNVLLSNVQQFAAGVLTSETDVTYVYDRDMYPGLGVNLKVSRNVMDYLFDYCSIRKLFNELDLHNTNIFN